MRNPEQSSTNAALNDVRQAAALNERESELLRRSGERIFALSRKVAAAEREIERLRTELHQSQLLADEVRRTRDVLSAQVTALLNERDRDYMERAELRRLLASLQSQMQTILANVVTGSSVDSANAPRLIGRALPQRGGHVPMSLPAAR